METNAGKEAHYEDHKYSEHGATIVYTRKEAFETGFVLKVEPPKLEEIELNEARHDLDFCYSNGSSERKLYQGHH